MADSGGSIPPGTKGHTGSVGDERKAKASEKNPQGADLPAPNLTLSGSRSTQDSLQPPEGMRIFVKTLTGKEIRLQVAPDDTLEKVKVQITEKTGIPPDNQVLVFNKHQFEDYDTLLQCNVTEGATIHLLARSQKRKDDHSDAAGSDTTYRSDDSATGSVLNDPDQKTRPKNKNASSLEDTGHSKKVQGLFVGGIAQVFQQKDTSRSPEQKKRECNVKELTKGKLTENETKLSIQNPKAEPAAGKQDMKKIKPSKAGNRNSMTDEHDIHTNDEQDLGEGEKSDEMSAKQTKAHSTDADSEQAQASHTTDTDEYKGLDMRDLSESTVLVSHPKSTSMQIIVTTPGKKEIPLDVKRDDSIAKIKAIIKDESDIGVDKWCLCYNRVKLEDENKTLADYSIQNRAALIILIPRNTGNKDQSVDRKGSSALGEQESKIEHTVQPGGMVAEGAMSKTEKGESDEEENPKFQNDFDESIGNPPHFIQELSHNGIIHEGLDLKLECSISKPDLKAVWSKDGHLLEDTKRIRPVSSGTIHSLEIEEVRIKDSGEYSVQIGDVKSTSTVAVKEKPVTFSLSLLDKVVTEKGMDVVLKCIVSKPGLKARWTVNDEPVHSSGRIEVLSSGMQHSLIIRNVVIEDAAEYCVQFGDLQQKTILKVLEWSYKDEGSLTVKSGESMQLQIIFKGSKPKISFQYNGEEHPDKRRTSTKIKNSKVFFCLENVVPSDKGKYILVAENATGSGAVSVVLNVLNKPSAPKDLTVQDITVDSCQLRWEKPENRVGSNIKKYIVQICEADKIKKWVVAGSTARTEFIVKELRSNTQYLFRVAGENELGIGDFAELLEPITTNVCEWKYDDARTVKVKCGDSMLLQVPFEGSKPTVSMLHNHGPVQKMKRLKAEIIDNCVNCQLQEIDHADNGIYTLRVTNDTGEGTVVATLIVLERPSVPENLTAVTTTALSCQLKWREPVDLGGSNIKEYIVEMYLALNRNKYQKIESFRCTTTSLNIEDLDSRKQYLFRVAAENEVDIGEFTALHKLTTAKKQNDSDIEQTESDSESIGSASDDTNENNMGQYMSLEQTSMVQPPTQAISTDVVSKAMTDGKTMHTIPKQPQGANENKMKTSTSQETDEVKNDLSTMFGKMSLTEREELKKENNKDLENKQGAPQMQLREDKKVNPYFWNLSVNPALNGKLILNVSPGRSRIGNKDTTPPPEILLYCSGIANDHAEIINSNGNVHIKASPSVKDIMVNGKRIDSETQLNHNDRVLFAPEELYVFHHPQGCVRAGEKMDIPTFEFAQEEIARQSRLIAAQPAVDSTSNDSFHNSSTR